MRARGIKPGFFKNEELADLAFEARLLFAGLWCCADRAGRLEDRPKRIKAEVFPYDDVRVDQLLTDLQQAGFILRYSVNGGQFIQVANFPKHQTPHIKEAASTIPAPGQTDTSTIQTPGEHPLTPSSLTPSSLTPSSLTADSLTAEGTATPQREDAGALTACYLDAMKSSKQIVTDADKGQFARYAGQVLKQGCAYIDAVSATHKMVEKGLAPRLLGQLVNEVRAGPKMPANVAAALKLVQECEGGEM